MKTKKALWKLPKELTDYIKRLKDDGENIIEFRLDSRLDPKNVEITMEDKTNGEG